MGAEAVLMGTAFFASEECPIHPNIKKRLVETQVNETGIIMHSIRNPMRVALNELAAEVMQMENQGTTLEAILERVAGSKQKLSYESGDAEMSPIVCGQVVGLIDEVKTIERIIGDIVSEAAVLLDRLNRIAS
jgi:nitronate monooxygenase